MPSSSVPFIYTDLALCVSINQFIGAVVSLVFPTIGFERNSQPLVLSKDIASSLLGFDVLFLVSGSTVLHCPLGLFHQVKSYSNFTANQYKSPNDSFNSFAFLLILYLVMPVHLFSFSF